MGFNGYIIMIDARLPVIGALLYKVLPPGIAKLVRVRYLPVVVHVTMVRWFIGAQTTGASVLVEATHFMTMPL